MKSSNNVVKTESIPLGLRRISKQGKIVIPHHIRKRFCLNEGDLVETIIIVEIKKGDKK